MRLSTLAGFASLLALLVLSSPGVRIERADTASAGSAIAIAAPR